MKTRLVARGADWPGADAFAFSCPVYGSRKDGLNAKLTGDFRLRFPGCLVRITEERETTRRPRVEPCCAPVR